MSNPDDVHSSGTLPDLANLLPSTQPPSISTSIPTVTTSLKTVMPATTSPLATSSTGSPDFVKIHSALGSNSLIRTTIATIPKLTGNEDYLHWSNKVQGALRYCKIDKILTGDWPKPIITAGDSDSQLNAEEWDSLNAWITLHLNLSEKAQSQVSHLTTSNEIWLELKKLFKPPSTTSVTLHLTSIVNLRFDESTKFEDFVAQKREHNRLLGELGGTSLPDSYIAIFIRSGLPDHLKQFVAHVADDMITTDQLVNIIRARQQESQIQIMQSTPSDIALVGQHKARPKKHDFQPCKISGFPKPETHPTKNCWAPGGPKHDPNRQRKSNHKMKEQANKVDDNDDNDDPDSGATSMNIHIDRSFLTQQSESDFFYSLSDSPIPPTSSQAYLAKGPTPIIINSGTTSHIHTNRADFDSLDKGDTSNITGFGDGSVSSAGRGTAVIWAKSPGQKGSVNRIALRKALYVPSSNVSLLSVSKFDKAGCRIEFVNGKCTVSDAKTGDVILIGTMRKSLYYLDNVMPNAAAEVPTKVYHTTNSIITLDLMHRRLGHLNVPAVKQLFKKDMVRGVNLSTKQLTCKTPFCECCVRGKMQRTPLPKLSSHQAEVLDLVHSDLWGPSPVMPLGGRYYFITFTDDAGRYSWVYHLRMKSEAFFGFKTWHKEVERQTGRKLKVFCSNNGREYVNLEWELYMKEHGIIHQKTTPRTPQQNGVSERLNLTIMDRVRTILIESRLPLSLWAEAVDYTIYTKNRSPAAAVKGKTLYEVFWGIKPDISNLRVFGSQCYVHNDTPNRRKLDACAFPAIFIGYPPTSKAWRYYIPSQRKAGTSRNIIFDERVQSSVKYHKIEGELAANDASNYQNLLIPDPNFNLDNDNIALAPTSPAVEPSLPPISSFPSPLPNPSVPSPLPQPQPSVEKPNRRGRGLAKVYEKSRSSKRLELRNNPKTNDNSDQAQPSDGNSHWGQGGIYPGGTL